MCKAKIQTVLMMILMGLSVSTNAPVGLAQQDANQEAEKNDDSPLTRGLLDELDDTQDPPTDSTNQAEPSTQSDSQSNGAALLELQADMTKATQALMRGQVDVTVTELQADIVLRLDEWLAKNQSMQKSIKNSQQNSAKNGDQTVRNQTTNAPNSDGSNEKKQKDGDAQNQANTPPGSMQDQNKPSPISGGSESAKVDLNQLNASVGPSEEVWGLLPERIRNQMRALQIDRFLPQYQSAIEDYYRAISEMDP